MQLEFVRHSRLGASILGDLLIDGEYLCHFVENAELALLPEGEYQLLAYQSSKPCLAPFGGNTVVFHNPAFGVYGWPALIPAGQSGHSCCEIHPANWPSELKGCIAPGVDIENMPPSGWGVSNSRDAYEMIINRWGNRAGLTAVIRSASPEQTQ